jgi:hypothetical protein
MSGCDLPDALLEGWERDLLARHLAPERTAGGELVWDLDALPLPALKALCWPRDPAAMARLRTIARTGTEG